MYAIGSRLIVRIWINIGERFCLVLIIRLWTTYECPDDFFAPARGAQLPALILLLHCRFIAAVMVYDSCMTPGRPLMSDQTVGLPAIKSRWSRTRALRRKWLYDLELRPASAWAVVSVLALLLASYFWLDEGNPSNILFTAAVTGALVGFVVLLSRRVLFASVLVSALVVVVVAAAAREALDHEHGRACLRPRLLSQFLVHDQLPLDRPPALRAHVPGCARGRCSG